MNRISNVCQNENDASWSSREIHRIEAVTTNTCHSPAVNGNLTESVEKTSDSSSREESTTAISLAGHDGTCVTEPCDSVERVRDDGSAASSSGSPWYQLRKDATAFVSQTLQRGRKNLWHLTTSRISVLLSSAAVSSTSIHQFLKNYEDLSIFILAGEAFCGVKAVEFRQKLKAVCENYFLAFHRQSMHVSWKCTS